MFFPFFASRSPVPLLCSFAIMFSLACCFGLFCSCSGSGSCLVIVIDILCSVLLSFFCTAGPREANHPVRRAFRPQQLVVRGRDHASLQAGRGDGQARSGAQPYAGNPACVSPCMRGCVLFAPAPPPPPRCFRQRVWGGVCHACDLLRRCRPMCTVTAGGGGGRLLGGGGGVSCVGAMWVL